MIKRLLIRILFRLLDPLHSTERVIEESKPLQQWLARQWQTEEFRDLIHLLDMRLLQEMGEGVSFINYNQLVGRRFQLGKILSEAKKAFEKSKPSSNPNK